MVKVKPRAESSLCSIQDIAQSLVFSCPSHMTHVIQLELVNTGTTSHMTRAIQLELVNAGYSTYDSCETARTGEHRNSQ